MHYPGQVAFYYQEFPESLRNTATAMISLIVGIGFYSNDVVIGLVRRATEWLPDNINEGRANYVYWMMAGIGMVNLAYYLVWPSCLTIVLLRSLVFIQITMKIDVCIPIYKSIPLSLFPIHTN